MKDKTILFTAIIFFSLFSANVYALEAIPGWQAECLNSTHLYKTADIYYNNTLFMFNQSVKCQYGCDTGRNTCWKWPAYALPGEYYMLFEIMAIFILLFVIFRLDTHESEVKLFDIILPVLMGILFFILALQGNNVIDMATGEAVQLIFLVYFNMGLGLLSFIPFFFAVFKYAKSEVT